MKVVIDNVEFRTCTAIALEAGDKNRQNALFVHDLNDEFRNGDGVVFGYDMPNNKEDVAQIFEDLFAYTTDYETLETVVFTDH